MTSDRSTTMTRSRRRVRTASTTAAPAARSSSRAIAEVDEAPALPIAEVSYWPMLRGSMAAALLTLVAQCGSAAWVALSSGHDVSLRWWIVIPYLQISTSSVAAFNSVVFWSSMISTAVLVVFAVSALVRCRSLQTQIGRSFAFLDIALIGALAMASAFWIETRQGFANWMLNLALGGGIAFAVAAWVVHDRYSEREERAAATAHDQFPGSP